MPDRLNPVPISTALAHAAAERDRLKRWLVDSAYPLWWEQGFDHRRGGFHERLAQDGMPLDEPRSARVQPRQIFCYAVAAHLGWLGPVQAAVRRGLDWYLTHYRRPDGLFRTQVGPDGVALNDSVVLYDQAFALFGLASAAALLADDGQLAGIAAKLLAGLRAERAHPLAGFEETMPPSAPLLSNPHMHLLEACLAWETLGGLPAAAGLADEIATLALTRFVDPASGGVRECFDQTWRPAAGLAGRILEPGHQFEWAWLLLRWGRLRGRPVAITAALRLLALGETYGVDPVRGVAVNALLDDFSVHDADARLWPQTERIKAACQAALETGDDGYWDMAARASQGLCRYFETPRPGLWRDRQRPDGSFVDEPAPASSFYHIVCAILEFDRAVTTALAV
jgi:mannose/cellobiose epimerase-like protein (N-acyl-D-glucosamine 2-epimerase family)